MLNHVEDQVTVGHFNKIVLMEAATITGALIIQIVLPKKNASEANVKGERGHSVPMESIHLNIMTGIDLLQFLCQLLCQLLYQRLCQHLYQRLFQLLYQTMGPMGQLLCANLLFDGSVLVMKKPITYSIK